MSIIISLIYTEMTFKNSQKKHLTFFSQYLIFMTIVKNVIKSSFTRHFPFKVKSTEIQN